MAAANIPHVYQPLLDHDGVFKETFRFLLGVAHGIDFYIKQGKRKGCNDYAQGCIFRQSSHVIAHRDGNIETVDQELGSIIIDCYTKLLPYTQDLRERAQVFDVFSNTEYEHHPFHWHKSILLGAEAQLRFYLNETYMLCKTLNETTDEPEDQMEQLIFTAEHIMYSFIPQLQNITGTIRRLIIVPQNGYYSKIHASNIALTYRKGTPERRHAINQMVKNRCVPSKKALVELINLRENNEIMFVEEEWNTKRGRKKGYGLVTYCKLEYEDEYFFGRNMLALIAVPCSMLGISPGSQGETPKAEIGMLLGAPPKVLDFTEYIDDEQGERKDERLYFSPLQFPTPVDLNEAGKCASFQALKTYIKHASQKAGSPVTSRTACGGYKVFLCQHSQKCNYQFWVKWDMYGYYIHHYNHATTTYVGCPIHNHNRVIANPYVSIKCMYCGVKSYKASDMKQHEKICEANYLLGKNDKVFKCRHAHCAEQFLTSSDREAHEEENCCRKY